MAEQKILKSKSEWKTIWTNPNPNQNFAKGQIINVDLSAYSQVCFVLKATMSGSARYYYTVPVGAENTIITAIAERIWERYSTNVTPSYINFGTGAFINNYGSRTDDASVAVPLEVWAK